MESQAEFLYAEGPSPELAPPDPRAGFYREVAAIWGLPLGKRACVQLHHHDLPELTGRLELARAPDLPLNADEPLQLQIGRITFLSPQVQAWTLCE
jgi:hypothetical protein